MSISHPQTIKRIEQRPATRTTRDTQTLIISAGVYEPDESIIELAADTSWIKEKSIRNKVSENKLTYTNQYFNDYSAKLKIRETR
jgi:hypothetical protein